MNEYKIILNKIINHNFFCSYMLYTMLEKHNKKSIIFANFLFSYSHKQFYFAFVFSYCLFKFLSVSTIYLI